MNIMGPSDIDSLQEDLQESALKKNEKSNTILNEDETKVLKILKKRYAEVKLQYDHLEKMNRVNFQDDIDEEDEDVMMMVDPNVK